MLKEISRLGFYKVNYKLLMCIKGKNSNNEKVLRLNFFQRN